MKKFKGLKRRWLTYSLCVLGTLGLTTVIIATVLYAVGCYNTVQTDLIYRAENTSDYFTENLDQDYESYYQSCIRYVKTFEEKDSVELQFIDADGTLVISSYGSWAGPSPQTEDIREAIDSRGIHPFVGKDPETGERIIAVSGPVIYSNGEVIGVFRYITSTRIMDLQILKVFLFALLGLLGVSTVVIVSSNFYIRSILKPVDQITEKAKKIAGGTYGIQIQTKFDDEIGELADTINELSVKINQNEKMQAEFISSLSHELRTPLTAITGWSETLIDNDALDEETRRGMKIILREAKRLTEMVVDLLDFTRMQDGRMTINVEPTDIRGEFEDTVYMYSSRLTQDGIKLKYLDNDEDIPEISCDPKRLRQVFLNILDNAAKHGGEGKRIEASISAVKDAVEIRIRDFGPGIPDDEIPLVKKKFYKGSSKARGTGIGLAVCDEIVQMHGGQLILENAEGGGTLVTVRLPAVQ